MALPSNVQEKFESDKILFGISSDDEDEDGGDDNSVSADDNSVTADDGSEPDDDTLLSSYKKPRTQ